jgi:hypothetical protein
MQTSGTLAVLVLRYSFVIINWHQEEIQKLDRKIRKILTIMESITPEMTLIVYIFRDKGRKKTHADRNNLHSRNCAIDGIRRK